MWRTIAISLLIAVSFAARAQLIGVLEHRQCSNDQARIVRPLFQLSGQVWSSLASGLGTDLYPRKWFVAGSGTQASFGVSLPPSTPEPAWTFGRDFALTPLEGSSLPSEPNPSGAYGGWCDVPQNKPILVSSTLMALTRLPPARAPIRTPNSIVRSAFERSLPSGKLCKKYDDPHPTRIRNADLAVTKDLGLPGGKRLIAVSLKRPLTECGNEIGGVEQPRWFVLEPTPRFVGASMVYLASVALDQGEAAHLFWFSGYNEDGYLLFTSDFGEPQRFTWKYH
jgi:hypothetical protein